MFFCSVFFWFLFENIASDDAWEGPFFEGRLAAHFPEPPLARPGPWQPWPRRQEGHLPGLFGLLHEASKGSGSTAPIYHLCPDSSRRAVRAVDPCPGLLHAGSEGTLQGAVYPPCLASLTGGSNGADLAEVVYHLCLASLTGAGTALPGSPFTRAVWPPPRVNDYSRIATVKRCLPKSISWPCFVGG